MALEFVASILPTIEKYLVAPIGRQLGYLLCYNYNIEDFKKQVENLELERAAIQIRVDVAERNGEVILPNVEAWLTSVNEITKESRNLLNDVNGCFNGHCLCLDLKLRHQRSRKAKKKTTVANELKQDGKFDIVSCPAPPLAIGSTSTEDAEVFESRKLIVKEIMEALKDDQIYMIGIYGMGGVGKTTLAEEVGKRAKDANLCDEVAIATISQTPNLRKIQGEIADRLGLTKFDAESDSGRAERLFARLTDKKRKLIILDDIWDTVKLKTIGIPFGEKHKGCKIVFTSRRQDLCEQMNAQKNFQIEVLSEQEAWNLFQKMAGHCVDSPDLHPLAVEVAKECAGLPIAIVTVARALKNKSLPHWSDTANRLRKSNPDKRVFETLELSYNYLEREEAKSFFLLCCLFPEDFDIAIQDLLKYGMGLGLFQDVDTVDQARDRAYRLANDLKFSCLLQEGSEEDKLKMHDVIRDVAISIASKGKHVFLVNAGLGGKEWPKKDTYEPYTSISLMYNDIHELPDGLECPKLQFLLLHRCSRPSLQFPNNFFLRMENLKVLDMSGVLFLPPSLQYLKNLRTLCLDSCNLKDISLIGELKKLEILSFLRSNIKELSKEIGMLTHLRLLDLTQCKTMIPPDVIQGLSQLEGLYMEGSFDKWEIERQDKKRSNASLAELKHLSRLTILEIHISDANLLPEDLLFENLLRFKISIGTSFAPRDAGFSYSKILKLKLNVSTPLKNGVNMLLKKAEHLHLMEMKGLKSVLYGLDREGFRKLKCLYVEKCNGVEYIFNATECVWQVAFPILEKLDLSNLANLKEICHGQLPSEFFCQLQELRLSKLPRLINMWKDPAQHVCFRNLRVVEVVDCNGLKNLFSHSVAKDLSKLVELNVRSCEIMEEIFENEKEAASVAMDNIVFPYLLSLKLENLPNLINFCSKMKCLTLKGDLDTHTEQPLFDKKVAFPNLEKLHIDGLTNFKQIWHYQLPTEERHAPAVTLSRLRELKLRNLPKLRHVFTPSIARGLVQLQTLEIDSCEMMEEIIAEQREGEDETIGKIAFPQLNTLELVNLPNLATFYQGSSRLDLASLVKLRIISCEKIKAVSAFGCLGISLPLFNEKVAFPALEKLVIDSYILKEMWHLQLPAKSFSQLKVLEVERCHDVSKVVPFNMLERLRTLEELSVKNCDSMEEVVEVEGLVVEAHVTRTLGFQNLRSIYIYKCNSLKSLFSPSIASSLVQLQKVKIKSCEMMEMIIAKEREGEENCGEIIVFPKLHTLELKRLPNLMSFYTARCTLNWPSLKCLKIMNCPAMKTFTSSIPNPPKLQTNDEVLEEAHEEGSHCLSIQPLFDNKVALTNLELLWISNLENLQEIFHNQLPNEFFCQLINLAVDRCNKLSRVVVPSNSFPRLKNLKVFYVGRCNSVEEIFEGPVGEGHAIISLPQLQKLVLCDLPNLRVFYSGNYTLDCPSLTFVQLRDCPKMHTFSSGFISTPKLETVKVGTDVDYEELWKGDLNSTVQHLFHEKGKLKSDISNGHEVEEEEEARQKVYNKSEEVHKVEEEVERDENVSAQEIQHEISELAEEEA